jgi:type I restriction enzyme M protein
MEVPEMNAHSKDLQEKLWAAAEQLRANGSLKLNEISEPILGLIFLKFADSTPKQYRLKMIESFSGRKKSVKNRKIKKT